MELLLIVVVVGAVVYFVSRSQKSSSRHTAGTLDDAKADARQAIERLGGQIYNLTGTDDASRQALADAAERYTAAGSQIEQAQSPVQARLAKQTALEGLYYIRAARTAMGMDPGPEIPTLDGQRAAGAVTESRTVEFEGRTIAASPTPSRSTPNYFPGGRVAGRPVPAGWYSEPWWKPALVAGAWGVGSVLLFSTLFAGMAGVPYGAEAFAAGDGADYSDGAADTGGQFEDGGGESGGGAEGGDSFGGDGGSMFDGFDGF